MNAQADQWIIPELRVRQGENIQLNSDGNTLQEVTCDDIARLALAIYDKTYFFSLRRGLKINFCRDIHGGGTQLLEVTRESDKGDRHHLIKVYFDVDRRDDGNFLYEADLYTDQRKDYEPTINRGKHRFVASLAEIQIDWNSEESQQWRSDIDRLSKSPDTLADWMEADLDMLVRCNDRRHCGGETILSKSDLAQHVNAEVSLEDLKERLTCSKCGRRKARVLVL